MPLAGIRRALSRVWREPLGALGLTLVVLIVLSAVFASVLAGYSPTKLAPASTLR